MKSSMSRPKPKTERKKLTFSNEKGMSLTEVREFTNNKSPSDFYSPANEHSFQQNRRRQLRRYFPNGGRPTDAMVTYAALREGEEINAVRRDPTNLAMRQHSVLQQKEKILQDLLPLLNDFFSTISREANIAYKSIAEPITISKIRSDPLLNLYLYCLENYDPYFRFLKSCLGNPESQSETCKQFHVMLRLKRYFANAPVSSGKSIHNLLLELKAIEQQHQVIQLPLLEAVTAREANREAEAARSKRDK
jgi:hypothetical protein